MIRFLCNIVQRRRNRPKRPTLGNIVHDMTLLEYAKDRYKRGDIAGAERLFQHMKIKFNHERDQ